LMLEPGFCLYVFGRLHGVTRERLAGAVAAAGGRLVRRPSARVSVVAIGHSSALVGLVNAPPLELPDGISSATARVSEFQLKRLLGFLPPQAPEGRSWTLDYLARTSRLDPAAVECLALYDVLDPLDGQFGFRDLRAAREVKRLLGLGFGLDEIVEAALVLKRSNRGLFDTSLTEAPWGEILQEVAGRLGRLNGQFTLPLDEPFESVDEIFERAEECEGCGNLTGAERLYRVALQMDRADPVIPFNLGNILDALGRPREAALAYQQAIGRDATFAEAWVNLAALEEAAGRAASAELCLRRALEVQPNFGTGLYNLATALTRSERYEEAAEVWKRYLAQHPPAGDAREAIRLLLLCQLETQGPTWP
jgi:tetratricopeptide (TPR) repeat protein